MKRLYCILIFTLFLLTSCSGVKVSTDYDTAVDFTHYKTFAFYKKGIDKAKISDLDKRRILRVVEAQLTEKGMTKSEKPDILVSIFTKAVEKVDVYQDPYWSPYYYNLYEVNRVSKYTEGTLFIDLIDTQSKKLVWQGVGSGFLSKSKNVEKKEANVKNFVESILNEYPPQE